MNESNDNLNSSFFENGSMKELYREVRETYKCNDFPWVIGYSGGKDSTATVQIVWYALASLSSQELTKPIFIIASDTLVETPPVVEQINKTLELMEEGARKQGLPFHVQKVFPRVEDSYWVNLIGKGYPAPTQRFRWCTERLKIKPANTFILERAAEFGEVVMVLGARKSESMSRAQVMGKRTQLPGSRLNRHSSLPRAYVYTPIEDFTIDDVWSYLDIYDSPWGGDNRELASLYRRSNLSGECPLVIDTNTPSCGNSRFGCWVCTVVEQDRSMQALIQHGEEWMEPLLEFRETLAMTQIPERKLEFRDFKRRNGQAIVREDGRFIPGPYKFEYRKTILRRLLKTQVELQKDGPDPDLALISAPELHEIRRIWRTEESDWEDSVPKIYREVVGEDLDWLQDELGTFSSFERNILDEICRNQAIPAQLVTRLIDIEQKLQGMGRRSGIYNEVHRVFSEEWGKKDEILRQASAEKTRQMKLGLD
jgi:DNA sulfur modification protein DndC